MTEIQIVFIGALFFIIFTIIIVYISIKSHNNLYSIKNESAYKKEKIDSELLKILLSENSVNKIDEIIDTFIHNAGDMYNILVLSSNTVNYMTEEDINRMQDYIILTVENNMTDSVLELVKLIHKIDNQQDIYDFISLRTKLYMINFVVDYNRLIDDNEIK